MFRKGGSTGGITSGLRQDFAHGGYHSPHPEEDILTVTDQQEDIDTPCLLYTPDPAEEEREGEGGREEEGEVEGM